MVDERVQLAVQLFQEAYIRQMQGELENAAGLYRRSIEAHPTAEAYTFLGWTLRFQGKLEQAIAECQKAILVDPTFGNPYNDIGAYLLELGKPDEAIPWLERAIQSPRYRAYHYAWCNLGRVYLAMERFNQARQCFEKSLELEPGFPLAAELLQGLRRMLQ